MKTFGKFAVLAVSMFLAFNWSPAQEKISTSQLVEEPSLPPFDLPLIAPEAVPDGGTFWLYSASSGEDPLPPFPYDPYGGVMQVYALPSLPGQYLIADTKQDYLELQALQRGFKRTQLSGGMMSLNSLDFPGEGEEGEGGEWTNNYVGVVYGTNDLYLTIVPDSLTNDTATLTIHNPEDATNEPPAWLIWATTNLSFCTDPWALDADNWAWVASTESGQTNVTVPLLSADACFYRLADPLNDAEGDGIPDYYSWLYFGHQRGWASDNSRAEDDYDGDGFDNGLEYTNATNPNDLIFRSRFPNFFVNQTSVYGACEVSAGVPFEMAVLVNNTNLASAQWLPYTSNFMATLGSTDGVYTVRVALRGRSDEFPPVWDDTEIILDRVAPTLTITHPAPANATVIKPYLQLQGLTDEPLSALSYNLSNAFGFVTNVPASVIEQEFDTNTFDFTTNWFQAYDVPLATNLNHLLLTVTDRAGNATSTNLFITLDYTGATNPPVTQLLWPTSGSSIAGDTMTVRGQINDETAQVSVRWVAAGVTNIQPGTVERNGLFWIQNLPLNAGTNTLTLAAVDAAGNVSESSFTAIRGSLTVNVTSSPEGDQLYEGQGYVGGTASDFNAVVTVNGVTTTNDGYGNWSAANVPLNGSGVAAFEVSATPASGPTEHLNFTKVMPAAIRVVKHYVKQTVSSPYHEHTWTKSYRAWDEPGSDGLTRHRYQGTASDYWSDSIDGPALTEYAWSDTNAMGSYHTMMTGWEASGPMTEYHWLVRKVPDEQLDHTVGNSPVYVQHFYARGVRHEWPGMFGPTIETLEARTSLRLHVGGGGVGRKSLITMQAVALEYGKPWQPEWYYTPSAFVGTDRLSFDGERVDGNAKVWRVLAEGSQHQVEMKADASQHNSGQVIPAQTSVELATVTFQGDGYHSILNDTNGAAYPEPHWSTNSASGEVMSYPVLYESGSRMEAKVRFAVPLLGDSSELVVFGKTTNGINFRGTNGVIGGYSYVEVDVRADGDLPAERVDFLNPLAIQWSYAWTNDLLTFIPAGVSENPVYVTWGEPQSYANLRRTIVHLACKNTGATAPDAVVSNTWSSFAGPANVTTWDGKPLRYYEADIPAAGAVRTLNELLSGTNYNSQCDGLEELLREALHVNGIAFGTGNFTCAKHTINTPVGENFFLVKAWSYGPANTNEPTYQWILDVGKDAAGNPEMVPTSSLGGTVQNAAGMAGQNSTTPAEKIFGRHYVVRYADSTGTNTLYDPSYGKTYSDDADFYSQSVAGFGRTDTENTNTTIIRLKVRQ